MTGMRRWLMAAVVLLLTGCAVDGKYSVLQPMEGFDRTVNVADVREMRQLDRTPVQDVVLIGYIQKIRQRLETAHGAPCNCVVQVDSFGGYEAYSLSSSTIVLSSGLIAQASSEDEIAAVIAHEMGHIYQGDTNKGSFQETSLDLVKMGAWAAGGGGYTIMLGDTVDDVAKGLIYRRWNQSQEIEADAFATQLLATAGYSLDGLKMAVRRLGKYGEGIQEVRSEKSSDCIVNKAGNFNLNLKGCSKKLTGASESLYQSPEQRLEQVMANAAKLPADQRRRKTGGHPPAFASVDYLFGLNRLVARNSNELTATLAAIEAQAVPRSLQGNVAVTNKLAVAYAMANDQNRAASYLQRSLESQGRTAWTFNYLFKQADRSGDSKKVSQAIEASHQEVGFMAQLLPIEYYLAKRHGLQVYEVVAYGRCITNLVDDLNTYNTCAKFEKYAAQSGGANW